MSEHCLRSLATATLGAPILAGWMLASGATAQERPAADAEPKHHYHLFHPTPVDQMREFATDRPDKTESPISVDAGHFQVEMDLASFTQDTSGGTRTRDLGVAPINLKVGLTNYADFQVVFGSYHRERVREDGHTRRVSDLGDLVFRLKANLWGNDEGKTALAIMPYVKVPTSKHGLGNEHLEGGLIIPFGIDLPGGWTMALMTQFDFRHDEAGAGFHPEFVNSVTLGHGIFGELGFYVEFFSSVSTEHDTDWIGTVDFGLTYRLTKNVQLDAGCNLGVTQAADDFNPFIGLSFRF